jgi:hypothetical protein
MSLQHTPPTPRRSNHPSSRPFANSFTFVVNHAILRSPKSCPMNAANLYWRKRKSWGLGVDSLSYHGAREKKHACTRAPIRFRCLLASSLSSCSVGIKPGRNTLVRADMHHHHRVAVSRVTYPNRTKSPQDWNQAACNCKYRVTSSFLRHCMIPRM